MKIPTVSARLGEQPDIYVTAERRARRAAGRGHYCAAFCVEFWRSAATIQSTWPCRRRRMASGRRKVRISSDLARWMNGQLPVTRTHETRHSTGLNYHIIRYLHPGRAALTLFNCGLRGCHFRPLNRINATFLHIITTCRLYLISLSH